MPFEIPNEAAASFPDQAEPDAIDFAILVAALKGDYVISGCLVTAQGTPDMTVAVASGVVRINGASVAVSAGNVTIAAADATNPRFDLIAIDDAGVKSRVAGTASSNPIFPAIPANSIIIASVYVPANDTDIDANQIIDKRVIGGSGIPGGSDTQVQFNNNGVFGGDAGFVYDPTAGGISLAGTAGVAATGTLTVAVNPTDGDTFRIGIFTYTLRTVANDPYEVSLDAVLANTQTNIVNAINSAPQGGGAPNQEASVGSFVANVLTITARNKGAFGNEIITTETFTSGSNVFGAATLTSGADDTAYMAIGADPATLGGVRLSPGGAVVSQGQTSNEMVALITTEIDGNGSRNVVLGKIVSENSAEESMDVIPPVDANSTFGNSLRRWSIGFFASGMFIGTSGVFGWTIGAVDNQISPNADGVGKLGATNLRIAQIWTSLPTANPGAGGLWNDGGTVKVGT